MKFRRFTSVLILCCSVSSSSSQVQQFLSEPQDVIVREGDNVTLSCSVRGKAGTLQWTRDDFGLGTSRDLSGYSRYRMTGDEEDGEWHLAIDNIRMEDDARFQCQVGATETVDPIRSRYATLTVLASPQPPVITSGPRLVLREGKVAMVQCISKGGKPSTSISWRRNGDPVTEGVKEKIERVEDSKKTITVSSITFTAARNMSGAVLECEASNKSDDNIEKVNTTVVIEHQPDVSLNSDSEEIHEGDMVKMTCSASASPALVEYQWHLGGQEVLEARGAVELVLQADRRLHKKRVTCLARNKVGQSSADLLLDVKYGPVFVKEPSSTTGDNGARISLECLVDSNPPAQYTWIRNNLSGSGTNDEVVGSGSSLSFFLTAQSTGTYTCKANVDGYSPLTRDVGVIMRGPPSVTSAGEVQYGHLGHSVSLVCEATAVPRVLGFVWRFDGGLGSEAGSLEKNENFSIVESQQGNVMRSTLVISQVEEKHFGSYSCRVRNQIGEAAIKIKLKPVDALPLLILVSAAIGGLLLTIVLLVVCITCRKVHKKPKINFSPEVSKTSPQPDRLSNSSNETKANTLSSLSAQDDLDGSDSLPEYHANFMKTQPDILATSPKVAPKPTVSYNNSYNSERNYGNYTDFNNLYYNNYHRVTYPDYTNPYPSGGNVGNYPANGPGVGHTNDGYTIYAGTSDPMYSSGRFNAVAQKLSVMGNLIPEDLNESSIGTHV